MDAPSGLITTGRSTPQQRKHQRLSARTGSALGALALHVAAPAASPNPATAHTVTPLERAPRVVAAASRPPFHETPWFVLVLVTLGAAIVLGGYLWRRQRARQRSARLTARLEERRRAKTAIRASEEWFRAIFERSPLGIVLVGEDRHFLATNPAMSQILGYTPEEFRSMTIERITFEEDREGDETKLRALFAGEIPSITREKRYVAKDGHMLWARVTAALVPEQFGERKCSLAIVEDVTERKATEDRQMRMMAELDHRVKNNLAAVISLMHQTARRAGSLDTFMDRFEPRLVSLAKTHEALADAKWSGIRLGDAVRLIVMPYEDAGEGRISVQGDDLMLPADAATGVCLALNELAMNAVRHGALRYSQGRLAISWRVQGRECVEIHWDERRAGTRSEMAEPDLGSSGMGLDLIRGMIEHELGGDVTFEFGEHEMECRLIFPMTRGARDACAERAR